MECGHHPLVGGVKGDFSSQKTLRSQRAAYTGMGPWKPYRPWKHYPYERSIQRMQQQQALAGSFDLR